MAMPSEAEELWRYSGIDRFDLEGFAPPPTTEPDPAVAALAEAMAEPLGARSALVTTLGGRVVAIERAEGMAGDVVSVQRGRDVAREPPGLRALASAHDAFGELHDAYLSDVLLVDVAAKSTLEHPLVVVHLDAGVTACPHVVVRVGNSADVRLVELSASIPHQRPGLVLPVTELEVGDDSRLRYAALQILDPASSHIAVQASRVGRDATLRAFTVAFGGAYARVRTDCDLGDGGGTSALLAAYLGVDDQVHDFRTLQEHHGAHTQSELLFKGAVADRAHSVYSGLIRMHRGARGADARQTNHNLVLSEGAHADSVPNLDIDENDVRCSHASTVGPIDDEQRHYLESRGIEPAVAERLIVLGFFSDLAGASADPTVARWAQAQVERRLAGRLPAEGDRG